MNTYFKVLNWCHVTGIFMHHVPSVTKYDENKHRDYDDETTNKTNGVS